VPAASLAAIACLPHLTAYQGAEGRWWPALAAHRRSLKTNPANSGNELHFDAQGVD
jgi:hypothetical protein